MPSSCRPSLKTAAVVLLSLSLLAVLYFVIGSWAIFEFLAEACQWIRHNTFLGALLFIPCEAIWVVSCVPTTPLELAAGYAFGVGACTVQGNQGFLGPFFQGSHELTWAIAAYSTMKKGERPGDMRDLKCRAWVGSELA